MFFMMGISPGQKEFNFRQMIICNECGAYGNLAVYMTYTVLSLFFIPVFRWDRHYYVRTSCCGTVYELDPEVGKAIARGEEVELKPGERMTLVKKGWGRVSHRKCDICGYETDEDFDFCPKCGNRF